MQQSEKTEKMRAIKEEVLKFISSPLYEERVRSKAFPVIGEGNHFASFMFIGEAPGRNEARTGRPFCGAAGKILNELLGAAGLKREDVYITNIVKDRPPQNRDPLPEEIEAYGPFLDRQIDIIQPKAIVTLGRFAMYYIFKKFQIEASAISKAHGQVFVAKTSYGSISLVPLFHPAMAVYNIETKSMLAKDITILATLLV